jgi:non-ribosomal peptide synthetase component F
MSMPSGASTPRNLFDLLHTSFVDRTSQSALVADDLTLSYAELSSSLDRVAERLRTEGVLQGSTVGLCLERSPELIVSVLGIVKAGAAYVPIDPTYPTERIAGMLEDAQAAGGDHQTRRTSICSKAPRPRSS